MARLLNLLGQYRDTKNPEIKRIISQSNPTLKIKEVLDLFKHIDFNNKTETSILLKLIDNNFIKNNKGQQNLPRIYRVAANLAISQHNPAIDNFFVNLSLTLPNRLREHYQEKYFKYLLDKDESIERYMSLTDRIDTLAQHEVNKYTETDPLANAMLKRDYATIRRLVQEGRSLNQPFTRTSPAILQSQTPLQVAIALEDDEMISIFMNSHTDLNVNYVDPRSWEEPESALSLAILKGHENTVQALLAIDGIDVSKPAHKPLMNALLKNHFNLASILIERGEKIPPELLRSLLRKSVRLHNDHLTLFLLIQGAKPDETVMKYALDNAIKKNDRSILSLLYQYHGILDKTLYLNKLNESLEKQDWKSVALILATLPTENEDYVADSLQAINYMLKNNGRSRVALLQSILQLLKKPTGNISHIVQQLLPTLVSSLNKDVLNTVLVNTIYNNNVVGAQILLSSIDFEIGETLTYQLMTMSFDKNYEMANFFHQSGHRLTRSDVKDLLNEVAGKRRPSYKSENYLQNILTYLITHANDYELPEKLIIRHLLIQGEKTGQSNQLVERLLEAGISPASIFDQAIKLKLTTPIHALIDHGTFVEISGNGQALLSLAVDKGDRKLLEWLLINGVNPKQNESEILLKAVNATHPNPEIIDLLLDTGADPKPQCIAIFMALDNYEATGVYEYIDISEKLANKLLGENIEQLTHFLHESENITAEKMKYKIYELICRTFSPHEVAAFDILHHQFLLSKQDAESSMEASLTRQANQHFENKVEPAMRETFLKYPGETEMEKVEAVERTIKAYILDTICENCEADRSDTNLKLIDFIQKNKDALLDGDDAVMAEMRALTTANDDTAQVAWRGYDPKAPHDPRFPNLLTQSVSQEQIYSTHAASNTALNVAQASDIVRKRVAFYFLAGPDKQHFFSQLADMRRAHVHPLLDSPTCFPGAIGRIAQMGTTHPLLALPKTRHGIIKDNVNAFIFKAFADFIAPLSIQERESIFEGLALLNEKNARTVLATGEGFDDTLLENRNKFNKYLISLARQTTQLFDKINKELSLINEDDITLEEYELEIEYCFNNLSGQDRGNTLYEELRRVNPIVTPPSTDKDKGKEKESEIINPFISELNRTLSLPLPKELLTQQIESKLKKFIEFEIVIEIITREITKQGAKYDSEQVQSIAKSFVTEIFGSDKIQISEVLQEVFNTTDIKEAIFLLSLPGLEDTIRSELESKTSLRGLSKTQRESFQAKILSEFPDKPQLKESLEKLMGGFKEASKRTPALQLSVSSQDSVKSKEQEDIGPSTPLPSNQRGRFN